MLAANPGLAAAAARLPAGVRVALPNLAPERSPLPAERLWAVAPAEVALPEQREIEPMFRPRLLSLARSPCPAMATRT